MSNKLVSEYTLYEAVIPWVCSELTISKQRSINIFFQIHIIYIEMKLHFLLIILKDIPLLVHLIWLYFCSRKPLSRYTFISVELCSCNLHSGYQDNLITNPLNLISNYSALDVDWICRQNVQILKTYLSFCCFIDESNILLIDNSTSRCHYAIRMVYIFLTFNRVLNTSY